MRTCVFKAAEGRIRVGISTGLAPTQCCGLGVREFKNGNVVGRIGLRRVANEENRVCRVERPGGNTRSRRGNGCNGFCRDGILNVLLRRRHNGCEKREQKKEERGKTSHLFLQFKDTI